MEQFPQLNDDEVALLRCEFNTGQVLDEDFNLVLNDNQKAYTVFKDYESALKFANNIIGTNTKIEFVIYGKNTEVLKYITPKR